MLRVTPGLEEVLVAGRAAAVLGRGGACTCETDRIFHRWVGRESFLDGYVVEPVVTEVVGVAEVRDVIRDEVAEASRPRMAWERRFVEFRVRLGNLRSADGERVDVGVVPAERPLDDFVEKVKGASVRHLDDPENRGLDVADLNPDLEHLFEECGRLHVVTL